MAREQGGAHVRAEAAAPRQGVDFTHEKARIRGACTGRGHIQGGAGSGAKFREDVGKRVDVEYSSRQRRTVVFGAISDDGGRFFRTYEKFTGKMFVRFLGEMNAARGRAALIVDRRHSTGQSSSKSSCARTGMSGCTTRPPPGPSSTR